jgi:hypothetical protein
LVVLDDPVLPALFSLNLVCLVFIVIITGRLTLQRPPVQGIPAGGGPTL